MPSAFVRPLVLDFLYFDEDPLQISRLRLQDLLEHIEILRRKHSIDAEIERPGRHPALACGLVENFRRDRVIKAARTEKEGIELVLVFGKEF